MKGCYLVHFSRRYRHAGHYLGWSDCIAERLDLHAVGRGARLMEVVMLAGITFQLVRVWPDADRTCEAALKRNRQTGARYCPLCHGRPVDHDLVAFALSQRRRRVRRVTDADLAADLPGQGERRCPCCGFPRRRVVLTGDPDDPLPTWHCPYCGRQDLPAA